MNVEEEEFGSDSSDEDYVPTGAENAELSEEDDSGDDEDFQPAEADQDESSTSQGKSRGRRTVKKNSRGSSKVISRKRKGGIRLNDDPKPEGVVTDTCESDTRSSQLAEQISAERETQREVVEKKRADDLWDSFMKDVSTSRPKPSSSAATSSKSDTGCHDNKSKVSTSNSSKSDSTLGTVEKTKDDKVTIVKEYKFAGETVKMSTTVDANSKEAKQHQIKNNLSLPPALPSTATSQPIGVKRPGGGLSSILEKMDKRPKMSTLVKSKLDWDSFKSAEGIDDDLKIHNRGKDGYLERQAFLERTDHRQFEIERNLRLGANRK